MNREFDLNKLETAKRNIFSELFKHMKVNKVPEGFIELEKCYDSLHEAIVKINKKQNGDLK